MTHSDIQVAPGAGHSALRLNEVRLAFELGDGVFRDQGSPLYSAICREAVYDDVVLDLAANASPGQPPAFHLLSAVHFLVLARARHDLAKHFDRAARDTQPQDGAFAAFRDFCVKHSAELITILNTTSVQSTAVGRAGFLLPPLDHLYRQVGKPLNIIEVGCSAGLLLMFDHYGYDFGSWGTVGDDVGTARVSVDLVGDYPRPPQAIPPIASRVGVDLTPIDPSNPDSRRWLRALLFPEWRQEGEALEQALEMASEENLTILGGDANVLLPDLIRTTPDPVCVVHSMCLYYFPLEAQERFDRILREASAGGRTIHRLAVEMAPAYATQARDAASSKARGRPQQMPAEVTHTIYRGGASHAEVLARADRYGAWFEWLAPPAEPISTAGTARLS